MSDRPKEADAPPAGEHIHMPAPSLLPLVNAASLAGAIVFITMSKVVLALFLIIWVISTVIWIRSTVRDVNELPLDHH
jgi:hypothetical protein